MGEEGCDEDFNSLIYKYEILRYKPSLEADSDGLGQPSFSSHESSNGRTLPTVPKEISMIDDLRSTWQLQKKIYELETMKQEKILAKKREELYKPFQHGKEMIATVLDDLQYVAENHTHIQKILTTQVGENSLPIPRHLHEQTVGMFKTMADICNNYESMADTFAKDVDFGEAFANLSKTVRSKDLDTFKREADPVERHLNLLRSTPASGREVTPAQSQLGSTYGESNNITTSSV